MASTNSTPLVPSEDDQHQHVRSSQRRPGVSRPSMTRSLVTYVVDRSVPIHEQALLDRLSNYNKQLMSIDRRIHNATLGLGNKTVPSILKRHRKKRPPESRPGRRLGVVTAGSGVTKVRAVRKRQRTERQPGDRTDRSRRKLPMQELKEITSALCDVHMILTHLVGIELTPNIGLRRQAEGLEDNAFQTVVRLNGMALLFGKRSAISEKSSEFEDLFRCVSMILLRNGGVAGAEEEISGEAEARLR